MNIPPEQSDKNHLSLPVLHTTNINERLLSIMLQCPETLIHSAQVKLRVELLTILNQVHLHREKEELVRYKTTIAPFYINFDYIIEDLELGLDYVEQEKGRKKLEELVKKQALQDIFNIGKTVRMAFFENPLREIKNKNSITFNIEEEGLISGNVCIISYCILCRLPDDDIPIKRWADIKQKQQEILMAYEYLDFAEKIAGKNLKKIATKALSRENSSLRNILINEAKTQEIGFLETLVFVRSFCGLHGVSPDDAYTIPENLSEAFVRLFEIEEKIEEKNRIVRISWKKESLRILKESCKDQFADETKISIESLNRFTNVVESLINNKPVHTIKDERIKKILLGVFPSHSTTPEIFYLYNNTPNQTNDEHNMVKPPCNWKINQILGLSMLELDSLITNYPNYHAWRDQICDPDSITTIHLLIERIYETKNPKKELISRELFIAWCSVQDEIYEQVKIITIEELLAGISSGTFKRCATVFSLLNENIKTNILEYFEYYKEEDQKHEDSKLTRKNIQKRKEKTIHLFLMDPFDQDNQTGNEMLKVWHPSYMGSEVLTNIIIERRDVMIDYKDIYSRYIIKTGKNDQYGLYFFLFELINNDNFNKFNKEIFQYMIIITPTNIMVNFLLLFFSHIKDAPLKVEHPIFFDFPIRLFFNEEKNEILCLRLNKKNLLRSVLEAISDKQKTAILQELKRCENKNISDIIPDIFDHQKSKIFTHQEYYERSDIPIIKNIFSQGLSDEKIIELIIPKILRSEIKIQIQILRNCLNARNSSQVLLAMIAIKANEGNDRRTLADLKPNRWKEKKRGWLPKPYAYFNKLLLSHKELREKLAADMLSYDQNTPLSQIQ